jgi:3-phenylpropionate/cinnamic acid dioxygenase small subunit
MSDRLQDLIDERDVRAVGLRYARALDTRDWALLLACFTTDAGWGPQGMRATGHDAIAAQAFEALHRLDATQHVTTNFEVTLHGDRAAMRSYYVATHMRRGAAGEEHFVVAGIYHDDLVRAPDGWRIALRDMTSLWSSGDPALLGPAMSARLARNA